MAQKLTSEIVKSVSAPLTGSKIHYDTEVREFGLRITASGTRAFILNYRTRSGRERRYTISQVPAKGIGAALTAARAKAGQIKRRIREEGYDPLQAIDDEREAPTIADLCNRFLHDHVNAKTAETTKADYTASIENVIRPTWGNRKVAEIDFSDVDKLHRDITENGTRKGGGRGAPYRANRTVAMLSKMFSLSIRWKWRLDNPTKGIERNSEAKRRRYLRAEELDALVRTLAERDQAAISAVRNGRRKGAPGRDLTANNIVRLLLLTGARSGETMAMTWGEVDLGNRMSWIKPSAHTKQKQEHEVPLSAPARLLLKELRDALPKRPDEGDPVFPGYGIDTAQTTMKKSWSAIRERATVLIFEQEPESEPAKLVAALRKSLGREPLLRELEALSSKAGIKLPKGLRDLRLHDLRHSYASFLVNEGLSLSTIGALLGHTQASTTHRYAHLFDDPLRKAAERVGDIISGSNRTGGAEIVSIKGGAAQ
jgi:integrase